MGELGTSARGREVAAAKGVAYAVATLDVMLRLSDDNRQAALPDLASSNRGDAGWPSRSQACHSWCESRQGEPS